MDWLWWTLAVVVVLLLLPLMFSRLLWPGVRLLISRLGRGLGPWADKASSGMFTRLLVRAGNQYFRRDFRAAPASQRLLFLPYCLRPKDCPSQIQPGQGLVCPSDCPQAPHCELGQVRCEALAMGYAQVYVVASSRLSQIDGLAPSDQFIKDKLLQHQPRAALGVVCARHLRNRLLPKHKVNASGYGNENGPSSALQGLLLSGGNCRQAQVDWQQLRRLMAQGVG